ncbi:aromatase/cyclase [Streptomyces naphthomycinicus]|uniref:aromatase/cyclase n=1 Tax=Streptomyces naphthomycinicus TaxID=2872625 RepID=UPI001CEDDD65|nr:aromatase/cyclase [Streptomyces sp. TML10]
MAESRSVTHSIEIEAPATAVYGLVADAARWPVVFGPTVHVDLLEHGPLEERFRIWAFAKGAVASWSSRRHFDAERLTVGFRQERSVPPIASMGGLWEFRDLGADGTGGSRTRVLFRHDFALVEDTPESLRRITEILDQNSTAELEALKNVAELGVPPEELVFSFEDTVEYEGDPEPAYRFVYDCAAWPRRLPHVEALDVTEDVPGVQHMEMETRAADGTTHRTTSVRVCTLGERIVYKQTKLPEVLLGHSGSWHFTRTADGRAAITSRHLVMLDPRRVAPGGLAAFRDQVEATLKRSSRTTMEAARAAATGEPTAPVHSA